MVASLRERRRQALRAEILQAARRFIAEKGHAAMSMDELAAHVGISKPTLYSFFATKEELVVAAILSAMQQLLAVIEHDGEEHTPLQRLTLLLRAALDLRIEDGGTFPHAWVPDLSELISEHQEMLNCLEQLDTEVVRLVRVGIAQGEIDRQLDPATVVWAVYALVGVPYLAHFSQGGTPDATEAAATLATIFERGLRSDDRHPPH